MSIRSIWILTLPSYSKDDAKCCGKVVFSRYFPTSEHKARIYGGSRYIAVPDYQEFSESVFTVLGLKKRSDKFSESRDTCRRYERKPVFQIETKAGILRPIVIIEQYGLIFCCLPLIEESIKDELPALIKLPGVSVGFNFLLVISELIGPLHSSVDETCPAFADLHLFVSQAAPFGSPIDTDPGSIRAIVAGKVATSLPMLKQPTWKTIPHKGKSQLTFTINEYIRAVQYDSPTNPDIMEVFGTMYCKAELEGYSHDITINLTSSSDSLCIPLNNLILHPCVLNCDVPSSATSVANRGGRLNSASRRGSMLTTGDKVRFSPHINTFPLCHYSMMITSAIPIESYYQMKGDSLSVDVLMQLKLNSKVKNAFEHCEIQMPFYTRGPIAGFEHTANHGNVSVSNNRRILVWNIGQKFPSKTLETLLKATIRFSNVVAETPNTSDDTFSVGNNAYAKIFFKITDYTLSGISIDPKSILVVPEVKHKLSISRDFISGEYKVWNSHGDAIIAFPPPKYLP